MFGLKVNEIGVKDSKKMRGKRLDMDDKVQTGTSGKMIKRKIRIKAGEQEAIRQF